MPRVSSRKISGFDYSRNEPVAHTKQEWMALISPILTRNGKRRAEAGETFIHLPDSTLIYEVYEILPAQKLPGSP